MPCFRQKAKLEYAGIIRDKSKKFAIIAAIKKKEKIRKNMKKEVDIFKAEW